MTLASAPRTGCLRLKHSRDVLPARGLGCSVFSAPFWCLGRMIKLPVDTQLNAWSSGLDRLAVSGLSWWPWSLGVTEGSVNCEGCEL